MTAGKGLGDGVLQGRSGRHEAQGGGGAPAILTNYTSGLRRVVVALFS